MQKIQKTIPFTKAKYTEMQQKVVELTELREEVMKRLITAREMGDLSENGAYQYAKFELGDIGRQLRRFKSLLAKGFQVPKNYGLSGVIDFGSEVTIEKVKSSTKGGAQNDGAQVTAKKQLKFMIVSEHESDPSKGTLAYSSPMGKALLRKKVGDSVIVKTPVGETEYIIIAVS